MENRFVSAFYESTEEVTCQGIPFRVKRENRVIQEIPQGEVSVDANLEAVFFLGMVIRTGEAADWWGPYERNYDFCSRRIFLGDVVGKIRIIYEDNTQECIPAVFGVNLWNYDLYEEVKEWEQDNVQTWGGPYREPFESDPKAEELRRAANCMMENTDSTAEKGSKWVFGVRTQPAKKIRKIVMKDEPYKRAGVLVSAITGINRGEKLDPAWKIKEPGFFVRREYVEAVDKLSRRLYQFEDELPESDPLQTPEGFDAPDLRMSGNNMADILTNVYRVNAMDMAYGKIDDTGRGHTSSPDSANFGCYMGFGSWVANKGIYSKDIWSRDVGRSLIEVAQNGYLQRTAKCVDDLHVQMYNEASKYTVPNWKRIANVTKESDYNLWLSVQCKENDGHGALMLGVYNHYWKSGESKEWVLKNKKQLFDAVNWIFWQIEHPEESNFNKVLYSESEASNQEWGAYDLFSNAQCILALAGYARIFDAVDDQELAQRCRSTAEQLWKGCLEYFGQNHHKYGKTLTDTTDDVWTWEYKRFAPLFLMADVFGYDVKKDAPELYEIMDNSFLAQKDEYYDPDSGRQMGYGQGYLTEAAILLDRYEELTDCMHAAAKFSYHHTDVPYIVPEGVVLHGSKRLWFRNSDQGNGVQQGEIMKCIRLLAGIDDYSAEKGLRFIPRLPDTFQCIQAADYPVSAFLSPKNQLEKAEMVFEREKGGYHFSVSFTDEMPVNYVRVGPFAPDYMISQHSGEQEKEYLVNGRKFIDVFIDRKVNSIEFSLY